MNLYKVAVSLLIGAAPVSARLSSEEKEKDSSAIRELMAKVDGLKADNDFLKSEIASIRKESEKHRGLQLDAIANLPALDPSMIPLDPSMIPEAADLEGIIGSVPASGDEGELFALLFGLISTVNRLTGLAQCVSYDNAFNDAEGACVFGSGDAPNVLIRSANDVVIDAPEDIALVAGSDISMEAEYLEIYASHIEQLSYSRFTASLYSIILSWTPTEINGVQFPFNPWQINLGINSAAATESVEEGDETPAAEPAEEHNADARARFDAMAESNGFSAIFSGESP